MRIKLIGALIFIHLFGFSQIKHIGIPFYNFYPIEYQSIPQQAYCIEENIRGFLYVATNKGLIEYDGNNWISYPTAGTINSIIIHKSGRIYAGLSNSFGYFGADQSGNYRYHSLARSFSEIDTAHLNVSIVNTTSKSVFFISKNKVFMHHPESERVESVNAENELTFSCVFKDTFIVAQRSVGLCKIEGGKIQPIQGGSYFNNIWVKKIIPYDTERLLIFSNDKAYIFNHRTHKVDLKLTNAFNSKLTVKLENVTSVFSISSNNFGVTTSNDGVHILKKDGTVYQHFDIENTLPTKVAWYGKETIDGNIWIALDNGILKIENSMPFSKLISMYNKPLTINAILNIQHSIYFATTTGLYKKNLNTNDPNLTLVDPINFKCTNLSYYIRGEKGKEDTSLLCCTANGLYLINGNKIDQLTYKSYTNDAYQSITNPEMIVLGTNEGLEFVKQSGRVFTKISYSNDIRFAITRVVESRNGTIIASTKNHGIYFLTRSGEEYKLSSHVENDDLGLINTGTFVEINDNIYFNDNNKIFKFNLGSGETTPFAFERPRDLTGSEVYYLLNQAHNRNLWATILEHEFLVPIRLTHQQDIPNNIFKRLKHEGITSVLETSDSTVWFGGVKGVVCVQRIANDFAMSKSNIYIGSVSINNSTINLSNGSNYFLYSQKYTIPEPIAYSNNYIKVNIACPFFISEEENQFSYLLSQYDKEWSNWSSNNTREFRNLKEGTYTLLVKSRNIFDVESNVISLHFAIKTPWYRSWLAYIFLAILAVTAGFILLRLFQTRYKREKRRLEKIILQRTSEILDQKSKIELQAKQLDAINKNLMQLSVVARKTNNPVIILNPNLEVDWTNECFQKYFNPNGDNIFRTKLDRLFSSVEFSDKVKICQSTKKPISYSEKLGNSDSDQTWFQITISPVLDKVSNVISLIIIFSDITNILELNKIRDIITSVITHDLKSPLLGFSIFSKTLADNLTLYEKEQVKEGLIAMHNNALSIYNLLENLSDWFKSQRGEISFLPGAFDISVSINEVFTIFEHEAYNKGIALINSVTQSSIVYADENMVRTILRNLLSNAIKFSNKGSIIVSSTVENEHYIIAVSDEGIGIDNNSRTKLFNAKDNEGFGLLICKEFVSKNGGEIWFDDKEEKTTFKFSLKKHNNTGI